MEEKYQVAFELIMNAGNARASAMLAIEAARQYDFEKAAEELEKAKKEMALAHHAQTALIQQEAQGNSVDVNIILVHAQDHMTMAMMAIDNAKEFMNLYQLIYQMQSK